MARLLPGSLTARITIGFMVLVLTFGGISLWMVGTLRTLSQATRVTNAGYLQLALVSGDLDSKQESLLAYLRDELTEEPSARSAKRRLTRVLEERNELLQRTEEILADASDIEGIGAQQFAGTVALLDSIRKLADQSASRYEELLSAPPVALAEGQTASPARQQALKTRKKQLRSELQLSGLTEELKKRESKIALGLADRLDRVFREAWMFTLLLGILAVILGLAITLAATWTLRPLQRLRDAAGRIAAGDYAQRIPVHGPREISDLAREFNVMGQAIQDRSKELVRTERLATVGKMASMITHEVRNPLSSIGLNTELLEDELDLLPDERGAEGKALCHAITKEIDRLTEITEEYLQLARLPEPRKQELSLERMVESVASFNGEQLKSRGVSLQLVLPKEAAPIVFDEGQLRQALLNLLRNAADAVADEGGGDVRIEVMHEQEWSDLIVADSGPGIPNDIAERIFEAFVSSKSSGTGLGLALTQRIISAHGGTIEVSKAPEGGALFRIRLPRDE